MTENRALKLTYIACIAGKAEAFFKAFAQTSYILKKICWPLQGSTC